MKKIVVILILFITCLLLNKLSSNEGVLLDSYEAVNNSFRMGPILLKIDDDWLFEKDNNKYLRMGLLTRSSNPEDCGEKFPILDVEALADCTSKTTLIKKISYSEIIHEIDAYDIKIKENQLWVDLFFKINNSFNSSENRIYSNILATKPVYFYHPKEKKWWGKHYTTSLQKMNLVMYDEIYNTSNTKEKVETLLAGFNNKMYDDVISKRTFNLPSIKFYDEKFGDLITSKQYRMFSWYEEKEEDVAPKNENK